MKQRAAAGLQLAGMGGVWLVLVPVMATWVAAAHAAGAARTALRPLLERLR